MKIALTFRSEFPPTLVPPQTPPQTNNVVSTNHRMYSTAAFRSESRGTAHLLRVVNTIPRVLIAAIFRSESPGTIGPPRTFEARLLWVVNTSHRVTIAVMLRSEFPPTLGPPRTPPRTTTVASTIHRLYTAAGIPRTFEARLLRVVS